jgi:hypothetical protein
MLVLAHTTQVNKRAMERETSPPHEPAHLSSCTKEEEHTKRSVSCTDQESDDSQEGPLVVGLFFNTKS